MSVRTAILLSLLFVSAPVLRAAQSVSAREAQALIEETQSLALRFHEQTAPARLAFFCLDRFLDPQQQQHLAAVSEQHGKELAALRDQQRRILDDIENYEGEDWETLYGQTRLWARLNQSCLFADCQLAWMRFWQALGGDEARRSQRLEQVEQACRSADGQWGGQEAVLQVLVLWQQGTGLEELRGLTRRLLLRSDLAAEAMDKALLLCRRFRLADSDKAVQAFFADKIKKHADYEWCLEHAFLDFRQGNAKSLKTLSAAWPQMDSYLSGLLFSNLHRRFDGEGPSALEGQDAFVLSVACQAAADETGLPFLQAAMKHCQTPEALFAMSKALAPSDAQGALSYALRAAQLAINEPSTNSGNIIADAAALACRLESEGRAEDRAAVLQIIDLYFKQPPAAPDPAVCLTAAELYREQSPRRAAQLLQGLLQRQDPFAEAARMRLRQMNIDQLLQKAAPSLDELASALEGASLRTDQVEKICDVLEAFLWQLETETVDASALDKAALVAAACMRSAAGRPELLWAELITFKDSLSEADRNTIQGILARNEGYTGRERVRAGARWAMAKGNWAEALNFWQRLRQGFAPENVDPQGRQLWWQCRYYEQLCFSHLPGVTDDQVAHAIDVLLSTYPTVPEAWRRRLESLGF